MNAATGMAASLFEAALTAKRPVKVLMKTAADSIKKDEQENLHDIDALLTGMVVDYVRKGTPDDLDTFADDMLAFLDSAGGDTLKSSEPGRRYYDRWEHCIDLCTTALSNYDPQSVGRFVASRKHGKRLMQILFENTDGIRAVDLAKALEISDQNLAKLLREFEDQSLVVRQRQKKCTLVQLDFLGKAFMADEAAGVRPAAASGEQPMDPEMRERIGGFIGKNPRGLLMALDEAA
jgi:hypothetical protein